MNVVDAHQFIANTTNLGYTGYISVIIIILLSGVKIPRVKNKVKSKMRS